MKKISVRQILLNLSALVPIILYYPLKSFIIHRLGFPDFNMVHLAVFVLISVILVSIFCQILQLD